MSDPTRKAVYEFMNDVWDDHAIEIAEAYLRTKKLATQLRSLRRKDREAMLEAIELLKVEGPFLAAVIDILRTRLEEKP